MLKIWTCNLSLAAIKKSSSVQVLLKRPSHNDRNSYENRGDYHHQLFNDEIRFDAINKNIAKKRNDPKIDYCNQYQSNKLMGGLNIPNLKLEMKQRREAINQKTCDAILIHNELCRRERMFQPPGYRKEISPFVSALFMAAGTAMCVGSLCWYGIKYTKDLRAKNDRESLWPDYIERRIQTIFSFYGKSMLFALVGAAVALRVPKFRVFVARYHYGFFVAGLNGLLWTGTLLQTHPYEGGNPEKLSRFCQHFLLQGVVLASLCLIGGPLMYRLLWYTFGALEATSLLAITSPNEDIFVKSLPFGFLLGTLVAEGLGEVLMPPLSSATKGMMLLSGYKFYAALFLIYCYFYADFIRMEELAKSYPLVTNQQFDPIAAMLIDYGQIFCMVVLTPYNHLLDLYHQYVPPKEPEEEDPDKELYESIFAQIEAKRKALEKDKHLTKYELVCPEN